MHVAILGPLEVLEKAEPVPVGGSRIRVLLIRLALDAGRVVTVESLAHALWGDDVPNDPPNALQSLVSRLRRVLPDPNFVRFTPGGYCLDLPETDVDALHFERLVQQGRRALRAGEHRVAAQTLRRALELWRGEALSGAADAPFAQSVRARLEELRLSATEDRVEADMAAGHPLADIVAELGGLTQAHPLRERLRVLHIAALRGGGRQAEALAEYQQFRELLADQLGADPGRELQELHVAILRSSGPHREPLPAQRGNLRVPLTSFVGRAEEQRRLRDCLAAGRLVTLVGPGGAGKTRLATTTAMAFTDGFPGGVWLVELATVTDPADVAVVIAGTLGLRGRIRVDPSAPPGSATDRIIEALSGTAVLIILDNCEHVVETTALLVEELLGRCPRLRVLATSREPLDVVGETLVPVRPLALPRTGSSAADAVAWPAIQLFADRVGAVRSDFAVTDHNVATVLEICRRLDGLPLAIELAAARLRSLPLRQLAVRLDDRFRLLTGGSRTAVPRHRTLRAVVEWSWELLTDDERELATWLAMFPAAVTAESAAGQLDLSAAPSPTVLNVLSRLVDKSLVQLIDGTAPQYRMLETIREYLVERLADGGEIAALRARHADFHLRLAETAADHLRGPGQLPWLARLAVEHDNVLATLRFLGDAADADRAARLGGALSAFWAIRGHHAEATKWLRRIIDLPTPASAEARVVCAAGYLLNLAFQGGYGEVALTDLPDPAPGAAHPVGALLRPAAALIADDVAASDDDSWCAHHDRWTQAVMRLLRAFLRVNHGHLDAASGDLAYAVEQFRAVGERWGLATSLTWLANVRTMQDDLSGAVVALEESVDLLRQLDPDGDTALQRVWLAVVRAQQGDVERARGELLDLVAGMRDTPSARFLVFAQLSLGDLARHAGDLREAALRYQEAMKDLELVPFYAPPFRAMISCAMAHLAMLDGDLADAEERIADALRTAVPTGDTPVVAVVAVALAWLRWHRGDAPAAAEVLGAGHALRGSAGSVNPDVARLTGLLVATLGRAGFDAAYAPGRDGGRGAAVALLEWRLPVRDVPR